MESWERLKAIREEKGVSQQDLADFLGISQQAYSYYENGREMKASMLKKACTYLGCTPSWLLGLKEDDPANLYGEKRRSMPLTMNEIGLIHMYQSLNANGKRAAYAMIEGLMKEFHE